MKKVFVSLRKFDAYPKTTEDFSIKTFQGATSKYHCFNLKNLYLILMTSDFITVTIICFSIMGILFWMELFDYLTPNITEELFVDTSRNPNIQINLDLEFPSISCDCKNK